MNTETKEKRTVYLANPYGFSKDLNQVALPRIIDALEDIGLKVIEPFNLNQHYVDEKKSGWEYTVARNNVSFVQGMDGLFAVLNGAPPDEGVAVEIGIAIALNKPIFLFRDDFRRVSDSDEYPLNLMLFAGLPYIAWKRYYYTSIDEISSRDKALYNWATFRDHKNRDVESDMIARVASLPSPMNEQMLNANNLRP